MPRPSNTEERRHQIAEALKSVMATKGYDGATVTDVAKAAGLTAGLVHYHFKSKLDILLFLIEGLVSDHDANLNAALDTVAGDPVREVGAFIDVHLAVGERADAEAVACWIILGGEALRQELVREHYSASMGALTERLALIIRNGVKSKVFMCADVDAAACGLMAAVQGYFSLAATSRSLIPRGSAAETTKAMAQGLLRWSFTSG